MGAHGKQKSKMPSVATIEPTITHGRDTEQFYKRQSIRSIEQYIAYKGHTLHPKT